MIRRALHAATLLTLAIAASGCPAKAQSMHRVPLSDLLMHATNPSTGVWESAPWSGATWIQYGGNETLEIEHDLGHVPTSVLVYLSFDEHGGASALSAGDLARIVEVTTDHVTVRNGTEQDYFLRLVLQ